MEALKCLIAVTAGLVPEEPLDEHSRFWSFTSEGVEKIQSDPNDHTYRDAMGAALNYAAYLQNPALTNWVKLEWTWV